MGKSEENTLINSEKLEKEVLDYFSWADPKDIAHLINKVDCETTLKLYVKCLKKQKSNILAESIEYLNQKILDKYF